MTASDNAINKLDVSETKANNLNKLRASSYIYPEFYVTRPTQYKVMLTLF